MKFEYDEKKNEWLFRERGITFEDAISSVSEHGMFDDVMHPNQRKYPKQRIMVVVIDNYAHCVPYIQEGDTLYLKTVYPSRKFQALIKGDSNESK